MDLDDMLEPDPVMVHLLIDKHLSACGYERTDIFHSWMHDWTDTPSKVTCPDCRQTREWKEAAVEEVITK